MIWLAASVVSAVGCRSPGRFCSPKLTAVTAVPSAAMDWLSAAKKMTDSGCLRGGYSWSNEWMESFADPDIFGHFTASWFIEGVLPTITNSDDYAVCAGPQYFIWGGSYALVNPQCKNREAAAELLRSVCISGSMDTSSQDTTVIPGNRAKFAAMQPIELPQLGGQDIGKVYICLLYTSDAADD